MKKIAILAGALFLAAAPAVYAESDDDNFELFLAEIEEEEMIEENGTSRKDLEKLSKEELIKMIEAQQTITVKETIKIAEPSKSKFKIKGDFTQQIEYIGAYENQWGEAKRDYIRWRAAQGKIYLNKDLWIDYRARTALALQNHDNKSGEYRTTDTKAKLTNNQGRINGTKINWREEFTFETDSVTGTSGATSFSLEYFAPFEFTSYMPEFLKSNGFIDMTSFRIGPYYNYNGLTTRNKYNNRAGFEIKTGWKLPLNIRLALNILTTRTWYSGDSNYVMGTNGKPDYSKSPDKLATADGLKGTADNVEIEAILYYNKMLYRDSAWSLRFLAEGGFDKWRWSNRHRFRKEHATKPGETQSGYDAKRFNDSHFAYSLYFTPGLLLNYKATSNTDIYINPKAKYQNRLSNGSYAKDWEWSPRVTVGWTTKF